MAASLLHAPGREKEAEVHVRPGPAAGLRSASTPAASPAFPAPGAHHCRPPSRDGSREPGRGPGSCGEPRLHGACRLPPSPASAQLCPCCHHDRPQRTQLGGGLGDPCVAWRACPLWGCRTDCGLLTREARSSVGAALGVQGAGWTSGGSDRGRAAGRSRPLVVPSCCPRASDSRLQQLWPPAHAGRARPLQTRPLLTCLQPLPP